VEQLSLATASADGIVVVAVSGELDIVTSKQFDEYLSQARTSGDVLILDLSGLEFIDTTCLSILVRYWTEQTGAGGSLLLAGARYDYARALWITGLAQRLPMYDNVAEALAAAHAAQN
jgi:anti-sigma B factor antagonist